MRIYQISPDHQLGGTENAFPFRLRVACTCGWKTRAYWNPDKAANDLFAHQAETGTPLTDEEEP